VTLLGLVDFNNYDWGIIPLGTCKTIKYHWFVMVMHVIFIICCGYGSTVVIYKILTTD